VVIAVVVVVMFALIGMAGLVTHKLKACRRGMGRTRSHSFHNVAFPAGDNDDEMVEMDLAVSPPPSKFTPVYEDDFGTM